MTMIIRSCKPRTARGKFTWPTAQRRYNSKANGKEATIAMVLSTQGITNRSMNPRRAIERLFIHHENRAARLGDDPMIRSVSWTEKMDNSIDEMPKWLRVTPPEIGANRLKCPPTGKF